MDEPWSAPASTYRLQFHRGFTFAQAEAVVDYLSRLGVTHCYSSPFLKAAPGSSHGYDICDHRELNPEIGTPEAFQRFVGALREKGLGQILDFVPNHMGIDPANNLWWRDVLENGRASAFARYFDIDWDPVKPELRGKVLLPILGDQYGLVLERGELRLVYEVGTIGLHYFEYHLPIDPLSAATFFETNVSHLEREIGEAHEDIRELLSVLTALRNLPASDDGRPERVAERRREKEVARERMARLVERNAAVRAHVQRGLDTFNGTVGQPQSFDQLHGLLERQAYRLAYWRTASHEINYRRFFDVNGLAALRMEDPEVFEATHVLVADLLANGSLTGLRIDHPDGLYDPAEYFARLQALWTRVRAGSPGATQPLFVVAEKILTDGEALPADWQVSGTTGYEFLALVGGLFVSPAGEQPLQRLYARFTGQSTPVAEVVHAAKMLIADSSLASELNVLARALNRLSEGNRRSRDFTLETLRAVLAEVVACFPVYRTYVSERGWTSGDRDRIETAVTRARARNPAAEPSIFDFLREVLLPRTTWSGGEDERRDGYAPGDVEDYRQRLAFSMKLQQYTAPVEAKGVEDTAFYRHNLLVSANEVGGDPGRLSRSADDFHRANAGRLGTHPFEVLATATHDTKLGEDIRTRIGVLSEVPSEWRHQVWRWARRNAGHRTPLQASPAPDRNDEYRFYQVLVGAWPDGATEASPDLVARLRDYMTKAIKEAKVHTSWVHDNAAYDVATAAFVERVLTGRGAHRFLPAFLPFQRRVARLSLAPSLGQLALKLGAPGVPDTYQGSELWDQRLVDPDNRRPVDFDTRARWLAEMDPLIDIAAAGRDPDRTGRWVASLLDHPDDGRIKLWLLACGLRLRRALPDLFIRGGYQPLTLLGDGGPHVVGFARTLGAQAAIVAVLRLVAPFGELWREWAARLGGRRLALPDGLTRDWVNVVTGARLEKEPGMASPALAADALFSECPVAILVAR